LILIVPYNFMGKEKNPHAVALGRLGGKARAKNLDPEILREISSRAGKIGGKRRAEKLTAAQQSAIGRKAGLVGGKARAAKLTKEQRSEIARKAVTARWQKRTESDK
jgi:hypothetical protein